MRRLEVKSTETEGKAGATPGGGKELAHPRTSQNVNAVEQREWRGKRQVGVWRGWSRHTDRKRQRDGKTRNADRD